MAATLFIRPMHPKTAISPEPASVTRILAAGWVAQLKIHGHRAQIHIPADADESLVAYNRHGQKHRKELSEPLERELRRLFTPKKGWNVIDSEWLKGDDKIHVFDFVKKDDELLRKLTFPERWKLLPTNFISPHITVLKIIKDLPACLKVLQGNDERVEGLVFRSTKSAGFSDTSIVRCRKRA